MNNFKKGDRVVYTGNYSKTRGCVDPAHVGCVGTVRFFASLDTVSVLWDKELYRPAMSCFAGNLSLLPDVEIAHAISVLRQHGTVEFTPTPPPWEGDIYVCLKHYYDADVEQYYDKNDVRRITSTPSTAYEKNWRKIKAKEVRE